MKAKQSQNQRRSPSQDEGLALAHRMWEALGSKSRHFDQIGDWADLAFDAWESSGLAWEEFTKVVMWAITENEYTVANLRVARYPGKSLLVNQWENVQVFYDADMAVRTARERKKWKYGACSRCDKNEAEARKGGWCRECNRLSDKVNRLVQTALKRQWIRYSGETGEWWLLDSDKEEGASQITQGTYNLASKHPVSLLIADDAAERLMVDPGAVEYLESVLGELPKEKGFDPEEA